MRRVAFLLLMLCLTVPGLAQVNLDYKTWEPGIHKNMLITNFTFSIGKSPSELKYYLYTSAEWMLTDNWGLEGSAFINLGSSENDLESLLHAGTAQVGGVTDYQTHNIFLGPNYHFLDHKRVDLYAGIHPGLTLFSAPEFSFVQEWGENVTIPQTYALEPTVSLHGGAAYYARFFHAFVQARYVVGRHDSFQYSGKFNEFRFALGLGFNLF